VTSISVSGRSSTCLFSAPVCIAAVSPARHAAAALLARAQPTTKSATKAARHGCSSPTIRRLLGDQGYDSDAIGDDLEERGIEPVIPPKANRKEPIDYDRQAYKRRNLIERCLNALKQFRRIATRYDKTARAFVSMLCIGAARLWIKPSTRARHVRTATQEKFCF
jgi:transposase